MRCANRLKHIVAVGLAILTPSVLPILADEPPASIAANNPPQAEATNARQPSATSNSVPLAPWTPEPYPNSLVWVPPDVDFVAVIRVPAFPSRADLRVFDGIINELMPSNRPVPIQNVEQIAFVQLKPMPERKTSATLVFDLNFLRTTKPYDWLTRLAEKGVKLEATNYEGTKLYRFENEFASHLMWIADDRTVIVGDSGSLGRTIDASKEPAADHPILHAAWKALGPAALAMAFEPSYFITQARQLSQQPGPFSLLAGLLGNLSKESQSVVIAIEPVTTGTALRILLTYRDEKLAEQRARGLYSLVAFAARAGRDRQAPRPVDVARDPSAPPPPFIDTLDQMLATAQGEHSGVHARLSMISPANLGSATAFMASLGGGLTGKVSEDRAETFERAAATANAPAARMPAGVLNSPALVARRKQSADNLKQIGRAILQYEDSHGGYPGAATYAADGAPLLSWRVHLLPCLGHDELYKKFHLDEPWDSAHNQALLEEIPSVYAKPAAGPSKSSYTAVFAVVGQTTCIGAKPGVNIRDIRDGTSRTVMLIETKRDVPWTKPEDLAIGENGLPSGPLGGVQPGGVFVVMADGSVQFVAVDELTNHGPAPYTIAGGEEATIEPFVLENEKP